MWAATRWRRCSSSPCRGCAATRCCLPKCSRCAPSLFRVWRLEADVLCKHTPSDSADYEHIAAALAELEKVTLWVNEEKRKHFNEKRLFQIAQSLEGSCAPSAWQLLLTRFVRAAH